MPLVVVAGEPVVPRVVAKVGDVAPTEAWVRRAKDACRRAEKRRTVHAVDPLEPMRLMAAGLTPSE
jgi:hypothetical protein